MKNYFIAALIALAIVISGLWYTKTATQHFGSISNPTYLTTVSVNKSITVGPQNSVQALATSTARQWAYFTATTTVPIFCNLSDASSTYPTGSGVVIHSTEPFIINSENLYIGSIQCSATASTTLFITASQ